MEHGDWQTPVQLAADVVALLKRRGVVPATVLEPTCGKGAFLLAAASAFPHARLEGFEISSAYADEAAAALPAGRSQVRQADFFDVDWRTELNKAEGPLLVLGNPPWVTTSTLGALDSSNVPLKVNFKGLAGLDARTGKANFDISEWMLLRLLEMACDRPFTLAMLCKSSVARRVIEAAEARAWPVRGALYRVDAKAHFDAAVDAVLFVVDRAGDGDARDWAVHDGLEGSLHPRRIGVVEGTLVNDVDVYHRTKVLAGRSEIEWRSGVKHDCASVMEFRKRGGQLVNGLGEVADLEAEFLYPSRKGADVANGRVPDDRFMLVPQRTLGENTAAIRVCAPKTWEYLCAHRELLDGRKSSIYRGQPAFAVFGVGDYSFAPFKVAICGLYKRLAFEVVGPLGGKPVVLDDTSYFLPCEDAEQSTLLARALNGSRAQEFFNARVFWDAKRPINKMILQSLSLEALLHAEGFERGLSVSRGTRQLTLASLTS